MFSKMKVGALDIFSLLSPCASRTKCSVLLKWYVNTAITVYDY